MFRSLSIITALSLMLMGCGPAGAPSGAPAAGKAAAPDTGGQLRVQDKGGDITADKISKDVVGRVIEVGEMNGFAPSTEWTFEAGEFRRIDILERHEYWYESSVLPFYLKQAHALLAELIDVGIAFEYQRRAEAALALLHGDLGTAQALLESISEPSNVVAHLAAS